MRFLFWHAKLAAQQRTLYFHEANRGAGKSVACLKITTAIAMLRQRILSYPRHATETGKAGVYMRSCTTQQVDATIE